MVIQLNCKGREPTAPEWQTAQLHSAFAVTTSRYHAKRDRDIGSWVDLGRSKRAALENVQSLHDGPRHHLPGTHVRAASRAVSCAFITAGPSAADGRAAAADR